MLVGLSEIAVGCGVAVLVGVGSLVGVSVGRGAGVFVCVGGRVWVGEALRGVDVGKTGDAVSETDGLA